MYPALFFFHIKKKLETDVPLMHFRHVRAPPIKISEQLAASMMEYVRGEIPFEVVSHRHKLNRERSCALRMKAKRWRDSIAAAGLWINSDLSMDFLTDFSYFDNDGSFIKQVPQGYN